MEHRNYYTTPSGEVIDIIKELSFAAGNVFKYLLRPEKGDIVGDFKKADYYIGLWIENGCHMEMSYIDTPKLVGIINCMVERSFHPFDIGMISACGLMISACFWAEDSDHREALAKLARKSIAMTLETFNSKRD